PTPAIRFSCRTCVFLREPAAPYCAAGPQAGYAVPVRCGGLFSPPGPFTELRRMPKSRKAALVGSRLPLNSYFRRPSFWIRLLYRATSFFLRYASRLRRLLTIIRRPRREWLSLWWSLKCSVRLRIRSVRIATCTSGEPVSPLPWALSLMIFCLTSAVTDMLSSLLGGIGQVEPPDDPGRPAREFHQRHRNRAGFGEKEPVGMGHSGKDPALAGRLRA